MTIISVNSEHNMIDAKVRSARLLQPRTLFLNSVQTALCAAITVNKKLTAQLSFALAVKIVRIMDYNRNFGGVFLIVNMDGLEND